MTQLVIELLANRTPPSCISGNILAVAKIILPNYECITELPSIAFIRRCRGTLSYLTKLMAADLLARTPVWIESHTDGTSRRQMHLGNNLVRIAIEGGYKPVLLDNAIMSKNETSECVHDSIIRSFDSAAKMLEEWRAVTRKLYPGRQDLLDRIPLAYQLSIAKLAKSGWIMTDTCNAATKFRKLFIESIKQVAIDRGMPARQIRIYEAGEYCSYCTTVANSYLN